MQDKPDSDAVFPPAPGAQSAAPLTSEQWEELRTGAMNYLRSAFPHASEAEHHRLAEQIVRGIQWVHQKWGVNHPCPYCTNPEWEIGIPVQLLTEPIASPLSRPAMMAPLHPVTCTNCGNTVFVRAYDARRPQ